MDVINIKNALKGIQPSYAGLGLSYDPFSELATKIHTEIAVRPNGFQIYRAVAVTAPLEHYPEQQLFTDENSACSQLKRGEEVIVSIDHSLCFVHHFDLPRAALGKIASILKFEINRVTPFQPDEVFVAWHQVVENDKQGKAAPDKVVIAQYVIRKDYVSGLFNALRRVEGFATALIVRGQNGVAIPFALDENGVDYGALRVRNWLRWVAASFLAVVVSAVLLGVLLWTYQTSGLAHVTEQIDPYSKDAAQVAKKLAALTTDRSEISALLVRKQHYSNHANIIEELSKLLPDDTYLDTVNIVSAYIKIDGGSENPEKLIPVLEASTLFKSVAFAAPTYRNPNDTKSRFSIKLEFERLAGAK
jgi:general secretion pathway protein L